MSPARPAKPRKNAHVPLDPDTTVPSEQRVRAQPRNPEPPVPEPRRAAESPSASPTRRDFISLLGHLAVGASALTALGFGLGWIAEGKAEATSRRTLGPLHRFPRGGAEFLPEAGVFVVHDEQGIGVLSARCTHLGCIVRGTAEGYVCPCHGARFDVQGVPVAGPARKPLPWLLCGVSADGELWVELGRPGAARYPAEVALG